VDQPKLFGGVDPCVYKKTKIEEERKERKEKKRKERKDK